MGVILITPEGENIPLAKKLDFHVTNNMAEYEACIYGLEAAMAAGAKEITVYGDSMLIINQATDEWEVRDEKLKPYAERLQNVLGNFQKCNLFHLSRDDNQMADALATLASMWSNPEGVTMKPLLMARSKRPCYEAEPVMCLYGPREKPWFYDILKFLETRDYPEGSSSKQRYALRVVSRSYTHHDGVLYRRTLSGILLKCLIKE